MGSSSTNLDDLYSKLSLEEDDGGFIIGEDEIRKNQQSFVLVGRFISEKNINFNAMQNVMASLWRPREGMEVFELGGDRFSFVFYHVMDLQKVIDGGPWSFEQSPLVLQRLGEGEDPKEIKLNKMEIWLQVHDLPQGFMSERILQSIGEFVGGFVKIDKIDVEGAWKAFARVRVILDTDKPLKRRMKIKREGGTWNWVNFKYERLSTFCFVCGLLGHSERDCAIVYANPGKEIEKAYGTWLRAQGRSTKNSNVGARWLRNGGFRPGTTTSGGGTEKERFTEMEGVLREKVGNEGGIRITQQNYRDKGVNSCGKDQEDEIMGEDDRVVTEAKRKRIENEKITEETVVEGFQKTGMEGIHKSGLDNNIGPKNELEAGPGHQARLAK
ncbi:uncharacterized protein LOC141685575 [Apium graveolens]|uniref:uncharacterized protein LOC141685575 n=1 Tax=Apium graveolens TaxID=4045 RepID=UPI003D7B7DA5